MKNTAEIPKDSNLTIEEIIPLMDKSYHTDENCTGCSTCTKICPVYNIKIVDDSQYGSTTARIAWLASNGVLKKLFMAMVNYPEDIIILM